jgi:hypothetical protein
VSGSDDAMHANGGDVCDNAGSDDAMRRRMVVVLVGMCAIMSVLRSW